MMFDAFVISRTTSIAKAPPTSVILSKKAVSKNIVSNEEADFFNQKGNRDVSCTSKENILKLYGSNTCQMPISPVLGVSGGMYVGQQAFTQMGMSDYPSAPNPGINVCNSGADITATFDPFASFVQPAIQQDPSRQSNMQIDVSTGGTDGSVMGTRGMGQSGADVTATFDPFASLFQFALQDQSYQPNMQIGVSTGDTGSVMGARGMEQVSHEMANLQLSGQAWDMGESAPPVTSSSLVIDSNQPSTGMMWPPSSNK